MHKSLFIALFTALSSCLFAQSKPDKIDNLGTRQVETYVFKKTNYDSIRFTIQGKNDTLLTEELYRNGQIKLRKWQNDSIYTFSNQGIIEDKKFYLKSDGQADSMIDFHFNGQIKAIKAQQENLFYRSKEIAENGVMLRQKTAKRIGKYGWYSVQSDSLNRVFYASFSDTLLSDSIKIIWKYDTFFYKNGQPYLITIEQSKKGIIKRHYYDEIGRLIEAMQPDSLRLKMFKDNIDCYYGLKKANGEIVYKPQFDKVTQLDDNLIAVDEGKKVRLMRGDGTILATPDMESVEAFSNYVLSNQRDYWQEWHKAEILIREGYLKYYLKFKVGKKQGIIDRNGQIVVPLQYRDLQHYYPIVDLFSFVVRDTASDEIEEGYINRSGNSIFPDYIYVGGRGPSHETKDNFYNVSNSLEALKFREKNVMGLINKQGELLLPCKFESVFPIEGTNLFKVYLKEGNKDAEIRGIFDAKKRQWLVDTSGNLSIEYRADQAAFIVLYAPETEKYGIIDDKGSIILPMIYDTLSVVDEQKKLFIARIGKRYQFLDLTYKRKSKNYDFLALVPFKVAFNNYYSEEDKPFMPPIFLAKKSGKWGLIDSNEQVLRPFTSDYAGFSDNNLVMVENGDVHYFTNQSFPNLADLADFDFNDKKKLANWNLADNSDKLFFFNEKGKIVIPPQYNSVAEEEDYNRRVEGFIIVEDAAKKRKLISTETGKVSDFPYDYVLKMAAPNCKIIVVADNKIERKFPKASQYLGVVNTEGQLITPCENSGISIADFDAGTYFVRKDTPTTDFWSYARDGMYDTLSHSDNNWFLYNHQGELLDKTPFRFPINFKQGLGIGIQGELYGIFRPDGSVISPPQYKNIRQDEKTGFYYLFENRGLTTTVSLKKQDGTTFVEGGRYDGISLFFGKYALAQFAGKMGLIDTFGREIIAPQDLFTYNQGNLMDSINLFKNELDKKAKLMSPVEIWNFRTRHRVPLLSAHSLLPDTLSVSPQLRNTLWNVMLAKTNSRAMWQSNSIKINRGNNNTGIYYQEFRTCSTGILSEEEKLASECHHFRISDNMLSFALSQFEYGLFSPIFYNFHKTNNKWNELTINDILAIQGEKRGQINELLIQKIKALKDVDIDCSNTSAFISRVENEFSLTKDGIHFYINSDDKAVVFFSWAELQPYLKMRF